MRDAVDIRAVELGTYIIKNNATVRAAAKAFGVSKSTVHIDVTKRLCSVDPTLYEKVKLVLAENKAQRQTYQTANDGQDNINHKFFAHLLR